MKIAQALVFHYKHVLNQVIGNIEGVVRAKRPKRLPVVFSFEEAYEVLKHLGGRNRLMANLLYGAGLRLMECQRLRVKDIDFDYKQIIARDGKGCKDRITMLPESLVELLKEHINYVRQIHEIDLAEGFTPVKQPPPA